MLKFILTDLLNGTYHIKLLIRHHIYLSTLALQNSFGKKSDEDNSSFWFGQ